MFVDNLDYFQRKSIFRRKALTNILSIYRHLYTCTRMIISWVNPFLFSMGAEKLKLPVYKMSSKVKRNRISDDTRKLVCQKFVAGESYHMISEALNLPYRSVQTIVTVYRKTGRMVKLKKCRPHKLTDELKLFIKEIFETEPYETYRYVQQRILEEKGITVSLQTIGRAVKSPDYPLRKNLN